MDEKMRPKGKAVLDAKVTRFRAASLPDTAAGGNVSITLDNGGQITAWDGSPLAETLELMREGDRFDFTYTGTTRRSYPTQTGGMFEYDEYQGVEIISERIEIGGFRLGTAGIIPKDLQGRKPAERKLTPARVKTPSGGVIGQEEVAPGLDRDHPQI